MACRYIKDATVLNNPTKTFYIIVYYAYTEHSKTNMEAAKLVHDAKFIKFEK